MDLQSKNEIPENPLIPASSPNDATPEYIYHDQILSDREVDLLDRDQQFRFYSAISHLSILLPPIGLIVPITVWITQRRKSSVVNFQALQATIYYVVFIMMMIFSILIDERYMQNLMSPGHLDSDFFYWRILRDWVMCLLPVSFMLYGILGAVQTFRGKDFRYLFLGNILFHFMPENIE
jgi:uncharacterized Tic20 family protein